jgi:hypothetical protein
MSPGNAQHRKSAPTELVRERSKQLLGGRYRAEVASAVASFGSEWFTKPDVADRLSGVPLSCITKELATLEEWELVLRHKRSESGHVQYSRAGFEPYWATVQILARPDLPPLEHPTVRHFPVRADSSTRGSSPTGR